jgi:cell shape-determining protein MreC
MKNKLLEFSVEKERTDRENERLMTRITQLEDILKNNGSYEEVKNTSMDLLSEEHIQIYTYILIKNFEVRRISNNNIEEVVYFNLDIIH